MRARKYTLPRHTNLANQGLRFVAAIVDVAIALALTLGFYFGCANLILKNYIDPLQNQLITYQIESHLRVKNADGNVVAIKDDTASYETNLQAFYLRYMANNPLEGESVAPNRDTPIKVDGKEVLPKDYYTVEFYNTKVLGITQENPDGEQSSSYFTYQKDSEGNFLKDQIAIRRTQRYNPDTEKIEELTDDNFLVQYRYMYVAAITYLYGQDFYYNVSNTINFDYTVGIVAAIFVAGLITYVVLPFFLKNGQTLGKKVTKLGLATYDGYKFQNFQLLLRFVPFVVVLAGMLLPIWYQFTFFLMVVVAIILISFAFMMASPKKAALHDYAARTIVVDLETSIIFENELEEEDYIAKEDGLVKEEDNV